MPHSAAPMNTSPNIGKIPGAFADEVAAIQLSWITYYGASLAALRRRHIGFDSVLLSIPMPFRMAGLLLAETIVIGFFIVLAMTGWEVRQVLEGDRLVSLTWVPVQFTQSVIPIGAALFVLCELLSLPAYWRATAAGRSLEHMEIEDEVETDDRTEGGERLQPKQQNEQLCPTCFLLVRPSAPNCPVGDDDCPIFG